MLSFCEDEEFLIPPDLPFISEQSAKRIRFVRIAYICNSTIGVDWQRRIHSVPPSTRKSSSVDTLRFRSKIRALHILDFKK